MPGNGKTWKLMSSGHSLVCSEFISTGLTNFIFHWVRAGYMSVKFYCGFALYSSYLTSERWVSLKDF